ncbi:MAG: peptidase domain protein [Deltaproteobacteria bacterium]|nr:peptidase domain protein [Deltaproteobacteria bacterium]
MQGTLLELEYLSTSWGVYAFVVVLGLLWGSFANVCIYRWPPSDEFPKGRSVVRPGSHCFGCKTPIRWYDNTPLISWLWLRGKCRVCKAPFSPRYLIVEALTGALFGVAWWMAVVAGMWWAEPFDLRLVRFAIYATFCFVMVVITFIDLDHKLILNKVTVPSIVAFYGLGLLLPERAWYDGVIGIVVGYGLPWLVGELYYRVTGREGLGLGDSMLLALIGALLGWQGVMVSLFGGSVVGSVIGIATLAVTRRGEDEPEHAASAAPAAPEDPAADAAADAPPSMMRTELPFGPFLAIAALFYLFAEPWIHLHFRLPGG